MSDDRETGGGRRGGPGRLGGGGAPRPRCRSKNCGRAGGGGGPGGPGGAPGPGPVPPSWGVPYTLAFDHESRAFGCPVGIESGTLETTTFQTAVDAETLSASQRRCAAPSMVLPGPSSAVLGLRY